LWSIVGYVQNGNIAKALRLFWEMSEQKVVSWNAMIAGYAQNGHNDEVLQLINQMQSTSMKLDVMLNQFTFVSILRVCASLIIVKCGKEVHARIIKIGFEKDVFVGSALVDMYSKCGSIEDACKVFNEMPTQNLISWNAMIVGYAQNGYVEEALKCFIHMEMQGMEHGREIHVYIIKT
jgi:pentatricopeptide repeat protein